MEWRDGTSYSRGDKERVPRLLELDVEGVVVVIHRIIHCEGWYLTVHKLNIEKVDLNVDSLDDAKIKGVKFVVDYIEKLENIKDRLIDEINNIQTK